MGNKTSSSSLDDSHRNSGDGVSAKKLAKIVKISNENPTNQRRSSLSSSLRIPQMKVMKKSIQTKRQDQKSDNFRNLSLDLESESNRLDYSTTGTISSRATSRSGSIYHDARSRLTSPEFENINFISNAQTVTKMVAATSLLDEIQLELGSQKNLLAVRCSIGVWHTFTTRICSFILKVFFLIYSANFSV